MIEGSECFVIDAKRPSTVKTAKSISYLKSALTKTMLISSNNLTGITLKNINKAS